MLDDPDDLEDEPEDESEPEPEYEELELLELLLLFLRRLALCGETVDCEGLRGVADLYASRSVITSHSSE